MRELISYYDKKKSLIKKRLNDFKTLYRGRNGGIFQELCFCILTPQSKAVCCDRAVKKLLKSNLLFRGREKDIKAKLRGLVRFHNKKAAYIVAARKTFANSKRLDIKSKLDASDVFKTREWLVKNIKGLGYKEASHFLRNIGLGQDIAILDVHIMRNLKRLGVIKGIPDSFNKKCYVDTENKMRRFAKKINIPLDELDFLFWSKETGFVFK